MKVSLAVALSTAILYWLVIFRHQVIFAVCNVISYLTTFVSLDLLFPKLISSGLSYHLSSRIVTAEPVQEKLKIKQGGNHPMTMPPVLTMSISDGEPFASGEP